MDCKKLGERIRQARKALHYSQEQFAGEIGYSVPHISHVENARTTLSVEDVYKRQCIAGRCCSGTSAF